MADLREAWGADAIPDGAGELINLMTIANACEFFHCLPEQVVAHDYALLVSVMNVAGAMRK
jgi:hypothetical protein